MGSSIAVAFDVPAQRVSDLINCGLDGGMSRAWARVDSQSGDPVDSGSITFSAWDDATRYVHKNGLKVFVLDAASIQSGLRIMATDYGKHFGQWMDDNEDEITGDVFLQCCLFGEVVFG